MQKTFQFQNLTIQNNDRSLFQNWLNEQPGDYNIAFWMEIPSGIYISSGMYESSVSNLFFIPGGSEVSIAEDGTVSVNVKYPTPARSVEEIIERRKQRRGWDE